MEKRNSEDVDKKNITLRYLIDIQINVNNKLTLYNKKNHNNMNHKRMLYANNKKLKIALFK